MIKLTQICADKKTNSYAVIIAGGPGLSSLTVRSLDLLKRSLNLIYVDLQGTNGTSFIKGCTYEGLILTLKNELRKVVPLDSHIFTIGHSFGGYFASSLVDLDFARGVFCLSTPFSKESLVAATGNYNKKKTKALTEAESQWAEKKDNESFNKWLSEYGDMYFLLEKGRELLLTDRSSAEFFLSYRSDAGRLENLLGSLAATQKLKVFIAAKQDGLLPEQQLEEDARRGGFRFLSVDGASHFVSFDQPEIVASLIEKCIATLK